jgi:hypothetical protein
VQVARLRRSLAALPLPAWEDGRIRLAADVSNWLRPGAETSPERLSCHCYARGKGNAQMIPGWPYSFVAALPGDRSPEPLWLWSSRASTDAGAVNRSWQAFLRRFDIEHTFRFFRQVLGWTRPRLRDPAAADRWTWLIIACYAQLYRARPLAADLRLPWQRPCPDGRLTPARVRRGFRNIRQKLPGLASAPKPGKPGPGRPPGSRNRRPATRHDVGKTIKRARTKKTARRQKG